MFELGDEHLNCLLVYQNGNLLDASLEPHIKRYILRYPESRKSSIWLDSVVAKPSTKDVSEGRWLCPGGGQSRPHALPMMFSSEQYREGPAGKRHNFNQSKERFVDSKWGYPMTTLSNSIADNKCVFKEQKCITTDELIYTKSENYKNVKGKSVIVACGGPSFSDVSWERLGFDFIWSCNEFYLNPKSDDVSVSLATVAPGFKILDNDKFINYMLKNDTSICFEIERGDYRKDYEIMHKFANKYPRQSSFFNTRYRSCLGLGPRLIILAILLGASEVAVVGLDGIPRSDNDGSLTHAFNGNKSLPNWFKKLGKPPLYESSHRIQERQLLIFWEYIAKLQQENNFKIYNLGEDHNCNISTPITKKLFPIPQKIQEAIK